MREAVNASHLSYQRSSWFISTGSIVHVAMKFMHWLMKWTIINCNRRLCARTIKSGKYQPIIVTFTVPYLNDSFPEHDKRQAMTQLSTSLWTAVKTVRTHVRSQRMRFVHQRNNAVHSSFISQNINVLIPKLLSPTTKKALKEITCWWWYGSRRISLANI